jgi:hypothetical protein
VSRVSLWNYVIQAGDWLEILVEFSESFKLQTTSRDQTGNNKERDWSMSSLPVLTKLCPICYTNPPKYRCPRCSMQTCSLECSQAHKLRASCSGTRDPAKYIPKKEMKASTVDMDFNFLKTVQKTRDDGHREIQKLEKGSAKSSRRKLHAAKRKTGKKRASERGVHVQRLPQWMERTQLNKTVWDAS